MNFFRSFLASLLALLVGMFFLIPILFLVVGGLIASLGNSQGPVEVRPQTVLHLRLDTPIYEQSPQDPIGLDLGRLLPGSSDNRVTGLYELLQDLDRASRDPHIEGIYLNPEMSVATGWASLHDIHAALKRFRAQGKWIYAYGTVWDEKAYFLATAADSIFLPAEGMVEFNGLASTPLFWKGLLDKVDLEPRIFRVGTFKSAVEPFERMDMSPASRAQTAQYLGDLWDDLADAVALNRNLSRTRLDTLASQLMVLRGSQAATHGLIDGTRPERDILSQLALASGRRAIDAPNLLDLRRYHLSQPQPAYARDRIAVIVAAGTMVRGESSLDLAGSETLIDELRRAREDDRVKAVVLRINSPGGDALAAELIAEEVLATRAVKPVIASMGDYAASGGYYIAAPCDHVFANPSTLTGSIGVFGILWDAETALAQNLGLRFDRVETHPHATLGNPGFPMRPAEEAFFQQQVAHTYGLFLERVKDGRGFADSLAVDSIAQGRVWSGRSARDIRLVDSFGTLHDAIDHAARAAGLGENVRIDLRPRLKTPLAEALEDMTETRLENHPLVQALTPLERLQHYLPGSGVYALDLNLTQPIE